MLLASQSELVDLMDSNFLLPVSFHVRNRVEQYPKLDDRIKVFGFDDKTAAALKRLDLPLPLWAKVFRSISRQNPKAILIDKIFDKNYPKEELDQFARIMADVKVPVTTVGFVTDQKNALRSELGRIHEMHRAAHFGVEPSFRPPQKEMFFYGAKSEIAKAINRVGHAVYPGNGYVHTHYRVKDDVIVPHWCFTVAEKLGLFPKFRVGDRSVPTKDSTQILVNVGPTCIVLADATGHGASAALITAMCHTVSYNALRSLEKSDCLNAARFLQKVNYQLSYPTEGLATMTMAAVLIDHQTSTADFASAGHPQPFVIRRSGAIETVRVRGSIIGLFEEQEFRSKSVSLEVGDRIVLFSDGLIENKNAKGEHLSRKKVKEFLTAIKGKDLGDTRHSLVTFLARHNSDVAHVEDDVTIVIYEHGLGATARLPEAA